MSAPSQEPTEIQPASTHPLISHRLRELYRFNGLVALRDRTRLLGGKVAMMDEQDVFTLADGRKVHLEWIRISQTFLGFLEGSPSACSRHIREELRQKAELRGWQVIDTHGDVLPKFQCIASLKSHMPVRTGGYSYLDLCWFVDGLDANVRELLAELLPCVDWEHRALDGSWDDL
jgi:hypothetical protein